MTEEISTLTHRIHALLDEPADRERQEFLALLEHTLTDGYARALALEAERNRLQSRVGEIAAALGDSQRTDELAELARRLSATDGALQALRDLLVELRTRARELRAA